MFLPRLLCELHESAKDKLLARKKLEESWKTSLENKKKQLLIENNSRKKPGILLQQQCLKYNRYVLNISNAILQYIVQALLRMVAMALHHLTCYTLIQINITSLMASIYHEYCRHKCKYSQSDISLYPWCNLLIMTY